MLKLLSITKKSLLFSVLMPFLSHAGVTKLPVLSLVGNACEIDARVSAHVRLEADKNSPAYCFSKVNLPDRTLQYPHAFNLYAVTVTDYEMSFGLDIDLGERLREKVINYYPNGVNYDGTLIKTLNYYKNCNFQVNEVIVYTQQTNLVIRDSFYNRLEDTFKIPQGTTRTADYSFNRAGERVGLKIIVTKGEH